MSDDRRRIAWTLSKAARQLPPAERQAFREFLVSLPGGKPKKRKIHSWKRKAAARVRKARAAKHAPGAHTRGRRADPQLEIEFDG